LHLFGQGGGKPLKIHLFGLLSARLYKKLMSFLIAEANNFILNTRAISRPYSLDFSRI
jgi:hypothetical protein